MLFSLGILLVGMVSSTATNTAMMQLPSLGALSSLHSQARRNTLMQHMILHRNLKQSDQCISDTVELYQNHPPLVDVAGAFDAEYDRAVEECGTSRTCTIDEDTFNATPAFITECETAGGVIYENDLVITCEMTDAASETVTVNISYLNVDHCFHPESCSADVVARESQDEANEDLDLLNDVFSDEGTVVAVCRAELTVSDQGGNVIISEKIDSSSTFTTTRATVVHAVAVAVLTAGLFAVVY